ncbi:hypothetical protein B0H16DRAFT_1465200 [Mycena metata]|uniref:Uncharacterized protein n=1 Tax=Mycena metata TaxID=1033252 RepID=A0AAD7MZY9_9AGAR|nr:hypothetical protein B0H16DRAFT_1465200 [Mycena metata]
MDNTRLLEGIVQGEDPTVIFHFTRRRYELPEWVWTGLRLPNSHPSQRRDSGPPGGAIGDRGWKQRTRMPRQILGRRRVYYCRGPYKEQAGGDPQSMVPTQSRGRTRRPPPIRDDLHEGRADVRSDWHFNTFVASIKARAITNSAQLFGTSSTTVVADGTADLPTPRRVLTYSRIDPETKMFIMVAYREAQHTILDLEKNLDSEGFRTGYAFLEYNVPSMEHTTLPYISLLLASSLETLHLTTHGDSTSFLTTHGARCADLTEFSMFTVELSTSAQISTAFNSFLGHLTQIDTIDVDWMVYASFGHLAALPMLRTLVIRQNNQCKLELPSRVRFAALSDLQLHFSSFKTAGRMLEAMETPQLSSIELASVSYAKANVIRDILKRLQQRLRTKQLRTIRVDTDPQTVPRNFATHNTITLHTIEPLLSFISLAHVDIQLNAGFDLSDSCIAVSQKRGLQLKHFDSPCPMMRNTQACCWTVHLSPPKSKQSTYLRIKTGLRILEVGISVVKYPESVADFLSAVFPALAKIETYWECSDAIQDEFDSVSAWNFVETQLKFGVKVRSRERLLGQLHGSSLPAIHESCDSD